tara:strand:+ start:2259 stop:3062 length:804 start_codon:yes stop_codon:yes gene_type:complete
MKKLLDQTISNKESFHVYGFSDKLQIPHCLKLGSVTMSDLTENYDNLNYFETLYSEETIYIIRLRDVYEKWESGYLTELMNYEPFRENESMPVMAYDGKVDVNQAKNYIEEYEVKSFSNNDDKTNLIKNFLTEIHKIKEGKSFQWMFSSHANPNDFGMNNVLLYHEDERCLHDEENVFFIELKDLSNPKFLDWIKERDSSWKDVKSIPHKNKTSNLLKKNVRLFWDEHKTDENLMNPYLLESLNTSIPKKQKEVDYIRKNHERYIRL